jgi:hypothetical protein
MNCREWKHIEEVLGDGDLSAEMEEHLAVCGQCSRKLAAYRQFLLLYDREASLPQRGLVRVPSVRRSARLLAAAAVLSMVALTGILILPPRLEERDLRREHARELAESVLEGGLFEYADTFEAGWESVWF